MKTCNLCRYERRILGYRQHNDSYFQVIIHSLFCELIPGNLTHWTFKFLWWKSGIHFSGFKLGIMLSLPLLLLQRSHLPPGFITPHTTHSVLGRQSSCHFCLAGASLLSTTATSDLFLSASQDR